MEVWRDIYGFTGLYQVSNLGRVRSMERKVNGPKSKKTVRSRLLKQGFSKGSGYYIVSLWKNNKGHSKPVHALVLLAFRGPRKGRVARHLNGVPTDNRLSNLKWGSRKQNAQDMISHGTAGKTNKLSDAQIVRMFMLKYEGYSQHRIARKIGCSQAHVSCVLRGLKRAAREHPRP